MPTQPDYTRRYTVEEYFALEETSDIRHEYYHGDIFPLDGPQAKAGGTKRHNRLIQNCVVALRQALRGRGYDIFSENVRAAVAAGEYYNYPDVVVSCDASDKNDPRTVHQPVLIIEVLSDSTEARDRGWKFQQYWGIASLRHYLLVSQKRRLVEYFTRADDGSWTLRASSDLHALVDLSALGISLSIAAIYEDVTTEENRVG